MTLNRNFDFPLPLTASIDLVKLKYTKFLNMFNLTTSLDSDLIRFKKRFTNNRGAYMLTVFKEGSVKIYSDNSKLFIVWSVKLDNLYFLSIIIPVISFIMCSIWLNLNLLTLSVISFTLLLITYNIGYNNILRKIYEANNVCLEE